MPEDVLDQLSKAIGRKVIPTARQGSATPPNQTFKEWESGSLLPEVPLQRGCLTRKKHEG